MQRTSIQKKHFEINPAHYESSNVTTEKGGGTMLVGAVLSGLNLLQFNRRSYALHLVQPGLDMDLKKNTKRVFR